jgi:Holliday junction resolvasome RuvABC DNA-binding subunit
MSKTAVLLLAFLLLLGCEPPLETKIDKLIQRVESPHLPLESRLNAIQSLGDLGTKAHKAIPTLEKIQKTSEAPLQKAIEEALQKIKK